MYKLRRFSLKFTWETDSLFSKPNLIFLVLFSKRDTFVTCNPYSFSFRVYLLTLKLISINPCVFLYVFVAVLCLNEKPCLCVCVFMCPLGLPSKFKSFYIHNYCVSVCLEILLVMSCQKMRSRAINCLLLHLLDWSGPVLLEENLYCMCDTVKIDVSVRLCVVSTTNQLYKYLKYKFHHIHAHTNTFK